MGWFPWSKDDPLSELEPSLRRFLEQQSHTISQPSPASRPSEPPTPAEEPQNSIGAGSQTSWRSYLGLSTERSDYVKQRNAPATTASTLQSQHSQSQVPAESLYQDGRYADLWKTYRPSAVIDEVGKSDQEKLNDVVSGYRARQAQIKNASVENCALEQLAVHECFRNGTVSSRLNMCSTENRQLQRCIVSQTRFLKALGYLSMYERTPEESERIQMHADKLYQQQKAQEKAVEDAQARGEPLPDFARSDSTSKGDNADVLDPATLFKTAPLRYDELPKNVQKEIEQKRFKDLSGFDLELAKREVEQEVASHAQLLHGLNERYMQEHTERMQRKAEGRERLTDKFKGIFDSRDWDKVAAQHAEREAQRLRAMQDDGH